MGVSTPLIPAELGKLLHNYNQAERNYLLQGVTQGFHLEVPPQHWGAREAENLPSAIKFPKLVWDKIQKEVMLGRVAGPYLTCPFEDYIQSPVGLVIKPDKPTEARLIFHLSYPKGGKSVNSSIPEEKTSVKYPHSKKLSTSCWEREGMLGLPNLT